MSWSGVVGLGFTMPLEPEQSRDLDGALKLLATHQYASKRVSLLWQNDGQGCLILAHDLPREADVQMIANKLTTVLPFTALQIATKLVLHIFAGEDVDERKVSARRYKKNNSAAFEGEYLWKAVPVIEVPFVEAVKPDDWPPGEPWPKVSQAIVWRIPPEPEELEAWQTPAL